MADRGKLIVVTGPSGVGKSTIVAEAVRRTGAAYSVSVTTRRPRNGEIEGVHYRFVDRAAFEKMIDADELLEWAEIYGEYYGTPAAPVREAVGDGRCVLMEIDIQGGMQVHEKVPDATFVLILPPVGGELNRRLGRRGSEDEAALARRLGEASKEVHAAEASGVYNHCIVNDDLESAVKCVVDIIR